MEEEKVLSAVSINNMDQGRQRYRNLVIAYKYRAKFVSRAGLEDAAVSRNYLNADGGNKFRGKHPLSDERSEARTQNIAENKDRQAGGAVCIRE